MTQLPAQSISDRLGALVVRDPGMRDVVAVLERGASVGGALVSVVIDALERADAIRATDHALPFELHTDQVAADTYRDDALVRAAVHSNLIATAALAEAVDFVNLAWLVDRLGGQRVAEIQDAFEGGDRRRPATGPRPVATAMLRRLSDPGAVRDILRTEGRTTATQVAAACGRAGYRLLVIGIDLDDVAPEWEDLSLVGHEIEHGDLASWRRHLANVAAVPWSPYARDLADAARQQGFPGVADLIAACAARFRSRAEEDDRAEIAREIRALVHASGSTQRTFAELVGTSQSRLSTYANGIVTPSAAMMLRIRRTADALQTGTLLPAD